MKNENPNSLDVEPATPQIPLALALFFGAVFAAFGAILYATLLGYLPGKPASSEMPAAILWLAAASFSAPAWA